MVKTIFITGVTSGIGKACAEMFAKDGHRLIITGRRAERLEKEAVYLRENFGIDVLPLSFDVRERKTVEDAIAHIPSAWKNMDVLINNAGLAAGADSLENGNVDDWETMIDTNVKGLLYITKNVYPLLKKSKCPHIINIGSIAGKKVYANGNVYCATKFAVDALTEGMRTDYLADGVKVSQICPGAVETEFSLVRYKGDKDAANKVYKGFEPLTAQDIANAIYWMVNLPHHVNINDMTIMPLAQASPYYWNKKS